jgi:hypothetical protein
MNRDVREVLLGTVVTVAVCSAGMLAPRGTVVVILCAFGGGVLLIVLMRPHHARSCADGLWLALALLMIMLGLLIAFA